MRKSFCRASSRRALAVCAAFGWLALFGVSFGQAPIVFMTSESRLYRFDNGVQSFSVSTGGVATFHGVVAHNGNVLVADFSPDKIQRFSPSGTYLGVFASIGEPTF